MAVLRALRAKVKSRRSCLDADMLKKAVAIAREFDGRTPTLEASGGVNLRTVRGLAETGVDVISIGALTHSAPNFDIGMDAA